jgi:hypothetical protein
MVSPLSPVSQTLAERLTMLKQISKLKRVFKRATNGVVLDYSKSKAYKIAKGSKAANIATEKQPKKADSKAPIKPQSRYDYTKSPIKELAALPVNYTAKQLLDAMDKAKARCKQAAELPGVPGATGNETTTEARPDDFEAGSGYADEAHTEKMDAKVYYIKNGPYYLMYREGKVWINTMSNRHWCWLKRLDADTRYGNQSYADYADFNEIKKKLYTIPELMLRCQIYKPDDWDIKKPKNSIAENVKAIKAYHDMDSLVDYTKAVKI